MLHPFQQTEVVSMNMIPYRITPVSVSFLRRARDEGLDDLNQPVEHHIAEGGEPCRDVLRRARAGERLILASYSPFNISGPYREYGPVFILADPAAQLTLTALPIGGQQPYFGNQFVLRAYSAQERIVDAALVSPDNAEDSLQGFLGRKDVAAVVARFAAYGCFGCRIVRAD
jgi:hypothetical protein